MNSGFVSLVQEARVFAQLQMIANKLEILVKNTIRLLKKTYVRRASNILGKPLPQRSLSFSCLFPIIHKML